METNKHLSISYALSISNSCRSGESFSRCWSINQRFLLLGGGVEKIGAVVSIDSFRGAVSAAMEMSLRRQADKIDVHRVNNTHKQGLQPFADASLDVKTCLCLLSFLPFPSLLPPLFPFTTLLPSSLSLHPTYRTTERDRNRRGAHA